jgi:hypothetical protein
LSPFLNNGVITEYFNREGKKPDIIDLLQIYENFKGATINGELTLRILTEISYSYEFLVLRDLMTFTISLVVV